MSCARSASAAGRRHRTWPPPRRCRGSPRPASPPGKAAAGSAGRPGSPLAPSGGESDHVGAGHPAVADVARRSRRPGLTGLAERRRRWPETPLPFPADRVTVEERLGGVLVRPVAGVDDRGARSPRLNQPATCAGTPAQEWRTTKASTPMASMVSTVSRRDSPLLSELDDPVNVMTSADSRLAAASNESRVRVESSKKAETMVLPRSAGTLGIGRLAHLDERIRQPQHLVDPLQPEVGHAQQVPWRSSASPSGATASPSVPRSPAYRGPRAQPCRPARRRRG